MILYSILQSRPARDAWIETFWVLAVPIGDRRRVPHGTRGLKQELNRAGLRFQEVASRMGRVD